jgi:hypothetical protein
VTRRRGILLLTIAGLFPVGECCARNEIFDALISQGVTVGPEETITLPPPLLRDGLSAAAKRQAIEQLIADRYSWERFTRQSVVSPFMLKIEDSERAAGRTGRRVDIYFVAYGSLDKLGSEDYLNEQLNLAAAESKNDEEDNVHVLNNEDLAPRGLPLQRMPDDPRWVAVESTLLGKVRISLTTKNVKTQSADSVLIASTVDSRFDRDAEFPNLWRSIVVDDYGRRQLGPPQPYTGLGSYVKATQLDEPTGAMFMEYHVAFAEPEGWFHGANLLRSKLPIAVQNMVRTLRRNLNKQ